MSIKRKVDDLGRICLPIEWRRQLGIEELSSVEMVLHDSYVTIKPTSADMTTKIIMKIDFLQNKLKEKLRKEDRMRIQYAIELLENLLDSNI